MWALLQTLPESSFSLVERSESWQIARRTLRQTLHELDAAGWAEVIQPNRRAHVNFRLCHPEQDRVARDLADLQVRLGEAGFRGEAIMKEYLSLLVDSQEYRDNVRPGFLINPLTDERMELDRYYFPSVGFEFQGRQHDQVTERFPSADQLRLQQARDLIKEALCARQGIKLVTVRPQELTLAAMRAKVEPLLPLRDLTGQAELVRCLERESRRYRKKAYAT